MGSPRQIVELNGKKYDAVTGAMIDQPEKPTPVTTKITHKRSAATKPIDGVVRTKAKREPVRVAAAKSIHAPAQNSKTLMRHVVKRPTVLKAESHAKPAPSTESVSKKQTGDYPEIIKPERVIRAMGIPKSRLVSRFGNPGSIIKTDVLPVKAAPVEPVKSATKHSPQVQATTAHNPIEHALRNATSHTQPKRPVRNRTHHTIARKLHIQPRSVLMGGGALVLMLAIGVLAYVKVPSVAMQVAATRSGVDASLPTYRPAGFSLKGPINYTPGQVSLQYKSNADQRDYKLVQQTSSMNSETLLSTISTQNQQYQTYQTKGRTIYIYDGNNATWVDGGMLYRIEGNANLNTDQLLKIANSL